MCDVELEQVIDIQQDLHKQHNEQIREEMLNKGQRIIQIKRLIM